MDLFGNDEAVSVCKYIEMWNRLPTPFKHKRSSTKTYALTSEYFHQLETGGMFKKRPLNREWLKKHRIDPRRAWSPEEIMQGVRRLSKIYAPENWPSEKDLLPNRLHRLLYNPFTYKSYFLMVTRCEEPYPYWPWQVVFKEKQRSQPSVSSTFRI